MRIGAKLLLLLLTIITHISLPQCSSGQEWRHIGGEGSLKNTFGDSALSSQVAVSAVLDSVISLYGRSPDKAIPYFHELLTITLVRGYNREAAFSYSYLVSWYDKKGMYAEADSLVRAIHTIAARRKMTRLLPAVYNSLGNRFQRSGIYDSALHYYYKAIAVTEKDPSSDPITIPTIYVNLSGILNITGDLENSLQYLEKAEKAMQAIDNPNIHTLILINKSNVLKELGREPEAVITVEKAIRLAREHRNVQWEHLANTNLGAIYEKLGDYPRALQYLEKAYVMQGDIDPNYRNTNTSTLANVYLALQQYEKAERLGYQTLASAEKWHISRSILEAHRILGEVYAATQHYEKAFYHYKKYASLKDTVMNDDMLLRNSQLEAMYRSAQKNKELAENRREIERKQSQLQSRNLWIGIFSTGFLLLLAVIALLYNRYRNSQQQKKNQEERLKALLLVQESSELKAMMQGEERTRIQIARSLHDGVGGLLAAAKMKINNIRKDNGDPVLMPQVDALLNLVNETAGEVRKSAHNLMPDVLVRQSLKEALLHFCEHNRSTDFQLDLQYDDTIVLQQNAELFVYRIIQELVQNVVKHAGADHAVIQLMKTDQQLSITVEDNGKGFAAGAVAEGSGLQGIRARIDALQGYFSISSTSGMGTTVFIELEYKDGLIIS